jgi:hypothetical protein
MRARPLILLLVAGCLPDFDDPSTVEDLRILSVEADTPELVVDVGPLATLENLPRAEDLAPLLGEVATRLPATFPPITLRPLIIDPRGAGRPVHVRAVVCLSGRGSDADRGRNMGPGRINDTLGTGSCPEDAQLLREDDIIPPSDGWETGVVPCEITLVPTREMLLLAVMSDPLGAVYGLPITVQVTATAGDESVIARKRVVFSPQLTPEQKPNANPTIPRLVHRTDEDGPATPFDLTDPLAQPPSVPLGGELFLEPERGEMEPYLARISDRTTGRLSNEPVKEVFRYAFFATSGKFGPGATTTEPFALRSTEAKHPLASKYQAPKALLPGESDLVRVWVVVRDERAGASHVQVALRLVP